MKIKNYKYLMVLIIVILQLMNLTYWGNKKDGYHMDEIFSFVSSNAQEYESLSLSREETFDENWKEKEYFADALTVSEEDRFSYDNVYYKQTLDVHPPLFYFGIHTMSSLFPEQFSKWLGIIPNMLYFTITIIVLYFLGNRMKFFGNIKGGTLLAFCYGFSTIAVSSVVFIRMYALMIMWVALSCYVHMRIFEEKDKLRWQIFAALILFFGLITQYYFIVFQFFVSAVCFFFYCFEKKWKNAFSYAVAMFAAIGATILYYPAMLRHIFSGYRGTEAIANFGGKESNFEAFFELLNMMLFDGWGILLIGVFLFGIGFAIGRRELVITVENKSTMWLIASMLASVSGYFLIVTKIAPYIDVRYISVVTPLIIAIVIWGLSYIVGIVVKTLKGNMKITKVCIGVILITLTLSAYKDNQVRYLYEGKSVITNQEFKDKEAIVIFDGATRWKLNNELLLDYQKFSRVYFLTEDKLNNLDTVLKNCGDESVIILENNEKAREILSSVDALQNYYIEKNGDEIIKYDVVRGAYQIYFCIRE